MYIFITEKGTYFNNRQPALGPVGQVAEVLTMLPKNDNDLNAKGNESPNRRLHSWNRNPLVLILVILV